MRLTSASELNTARDPRRAGTAAVALWTALQVTACGELGTEPVVDDSSALAVDSVSEMVSGEAASLFGRNLDQVTQITADGVTVSFRPVSDQEVQFDVPESAEACDVDGRPMQVVVNSQQSIEGPLRMENALRLEVGESRLLSAEDLRCLQFASGLHDYVLAAANFSQDQISESMVRLRSGGRAARAAGLNASVLEGAPTSTPEASELTGSEMDAAAAASFGAPFDDYANAQVGDVLEFVDWSQYFDVRDATTREEVPTYEAVVAGATEGQLFVVDARLDSALQASSDPSLPGSLSEFVDRYQAEIQSAAELTDQHAVPALRSLLGDHFSPLTHGSEGRMVTMVVDLPPGLGGGTISWDLEPRPWSSGLMIATVDYQRVVAGPDRASSTAIHEYMHLADALLQLQGHGGKGFGWYTEALARAAQDVAARMSAEGTGPATPGETPISSPIAYGPDQTADRLSPWGIIDGRFGSTSYGAYQRGGRILRYANQLHEQQFPGGPTLHERLRAAAPPDPSTIEEAIAPWDINAVAEAVGLTANELLEQSMVADLTDDLIPAEAVARFAIPQDDGWVRGNRQGSRGESSLRLSPEDRLEGGAAMERTLDVPAGGYAYLYIHPGVDEGVSIEGDSIDIKDHQVVRVLRLK